MLTEIGVASWYRTHEAHLPPAQQWTILWPTNHPTFKDQPIEADALQMLKCDENRRAGWQEDGRQWQVIFIQWNPGTRVQLGHSPNICMTAAGHTLTTVANYEWFDVDGLRLPFSGFEVMDTPQPFYIFYCLWNDRLSAMGSNHLFVAFREPPCTRADRNAQYRLSLARNRGWRCQQRRRSGIRRARGTGKNPHRDHCALSASAAVNFSEPAQICCVA